MPIITAINVTMGTHTMKTKIEPTFLYEGLGFPIELGNVEMVQFNDEWLSKIDVQYIANEIIKKLAIQEERLTGNQVKFIRSYFSMTLREFGKTVVHESHTAVSKWEKCGDEITNMNENTEQVLRIYIIEQTQTKTQAEQKNFYSNFKRSRVFVNAERKKPRPIRLLSN
jgi:DNA-binding transcriptional regulator YiaG